MSQEAPTPPSDKPAAGAPASSANVQYCEYGYRSSDASHTSAYLWAPVVELLKRHCHAQATNILDAGCGNGAFCKRLVQEGRWSVWGCDLSQKGIEIARRSCPEARFEQASVDEDLVDLFGRRFDAIVSLEVIEHLYDPRRFVRSVRGALAPRGLFVVTTPYHGYLKNLVLAATNKMDRHFTALWDGGHIKFWSRKTLTTLLGEQGFEVVEFAGAGRLPYLWKSMILAARCDR